MTLLHRLHDCWSRSGSCPAQQTCWLKLCVPGRCPIPVSQFILDALSATGRPELRAAFMLPDDSCALIANAFTYNMSTTMGKVSSLHCCSTPLQACSLHPCLAAQMGCNLCLSAFASLQPARFSLLSLIFYANIGVLPLPAGV